MAMSLLPFQGLMLIVSATQLPRPLILELLSRQTVIHTHPHYLM